MSEISGKLKGGNEMLPEQVEIETIKLIRDEMMDQIHGLAVDVEKKLNEMVKSAERRRDSELEKMEIESKGGK